MTINPTPAVQRARHLLALPDPPAHDRTTFAPAAVPRRWVLLDEHGAVVDIVTTPAEVGAFVMAKVAAGADYDVQTTETRCHECGERTLIHDDPHAPGCRQEGK